MTPCKKSLRTTASSRAVTRYIFIKKLIIDKLQGVQQVLKRQLPLTGLFLTLVTVNARHCLDCSEVCVP